MTIKSLAHGALVVLLLIGASIAQQPGRLPPARRPSIWSRLFGRPTPRPLSPPRSAQQEFVPGEMASDESSGVTQANWQEPTPPRAAPPKPTRVVPWPVSWLQRKRRPSRTVSAFMAEERP